MDDKMKLRTGLVYATWRSAAVAHDELISMVKARIECGLCSDESIERCRKSWEAIQHLQLAAQRELRQLNSFALVGRDDLLDAAFTLNRIKIS